MRIRSLAPALFLLTLPLAAQKTALRLALERVASGLDQPVYVTAPPGDAERLFIVEQTGRIKLLRDGKVESTPFLDLSGSVVAGGTLGLLGLAFHPNFGQNGYVFVNANRVPDEANVITRFTVSATDPDRLDPASRKTVLVVGRPFQKLLVGHLEFGPDGYLYVGTSDGVLSACGSQDGSTLHGKILRIDVDTAAPYAIPPSNPFLGDPTVLDEIWALGLRMPWRFSFDRATGDLYIPDVGEHDYEELNVQPASSPGGENYGWKVMEGSSCFNSGLCPPIPCGDPSLTPPALVYGHDQGCAVIGGAVYRGRRLPPVQGLYFFADHCSGRVWTARYDGSAMTDLVERTAELQGPGVSLDSPSSFGQDARGELYLCDHDGEVYRLTARKDPRGR